MVFCCILIKGLLFEVILNDLQSQSSLAVRKKQLTSRGLPPVVLWSKQPQGEAHPENEEDTGTAIL
ncbi:uncharacterized protein TrAtP1_007016 [Trichoderma atroviride]|uniref:uncharacterized protein n=1 Tax=Hypocrea atroviridis TaxID=63577 RepID=UPI00332C717E|nr:hypothetical protein TrAtP1_007016 [Trichoderma atroviride]